MITTTLAAGLLLAASGSTSAPDATIELRLRGRSGEPALLVRRLPSNGPAVLYIHGATFPSALSISWRIDGRSWMDDLRDRGFDVWAFDFAGYGGSDRPAAMRGRVPYGRARAATHQIDRVVRYVRKVRGGSAVSLIAHSWGTIPAGMFASARPHCVDRLVLFAPLAERAGAPRPADGGSRLVGSDDQWRSFQSGVPAEHGSPITRTRFDLWAQAYLATDPTSATRQPPSVRVPSGPDADFADAWSGRFPYDPASVRAPTLIVRGAWDPLTRDVDVAWLSRRLTGVPSGARVVTLAGGAHRMHLEERRQALFDAVGSFLTKRSSRR